MPHATEGDLHAYVDGALSAIDPDGAERFAEHVEVCADCRNRLEEARAVRDESARLLDVALGGAVEPPAFESILERAGAREPEATSRREVERQSGMSRGRRVERLAWAATVTVALGAGWMGHAVFSAGRPVESGSIRGALDAVNAPIAAEPEGVGSRVSETLEADAARQNETARSVPAIQSPGDPGRVASEAPSEAQQLGPAERRLAQPRVAPQQADDRSDARRERAAAEERVAGPPVETLPSSAARIQESAAPVAENNASEPASDLKLSREVVDPDAAALADVGLDAVAWHTVEREIAESANGGPIPRVPELEVLDYAIPAGDGPFLARVRQRLPGGETLELVVSAVAPGAEDEASLRDAVAASPEQAVLDASDRVAPNRAAGEPVGAVVGLSEAWIVVDGAHVRVAAPVAPDSLGGLISRVR